MLHRRQLKTRRRLTWRSLLHAPIPQLVVLAVVLGGLYALATSRVFAITTVQADPRLPLSLLRTSCACIGQNIFLARPADIQGRLDHRIPWVDVHRVNARLPNRIVLDATYRQPVALWRTAVATYTVDAAGQVLYDVRHLPSPAVPIPTTTSVPLIYSPADTTFRSGQYIGAPIAVQMALATRADLPADIARSIDVYRWTASGMTMHSRLGWWVALGINLHDQLRSRITAFDAAYHNGALSHCNYVDVRVWPNGVYCRFDWQWHGPLGPLVHH